jgi:hypothetical protein
LWASPELCDGMAYTFPHIPFEPVRIVPITHRPTFCLQPSLKNLDAPLYTVEACSVSQDGSDVCWIVFLISDEFEGDSPERCYRNEGETGRGVNGV